MTEDAAFIKTILASPADDAARLIYADWLEERGDARGEYLRVELQLASTRSQRKARSLRKRLQELRAVIKPAWLATFDQPGVLRANPTPFPGWWWFVRLEGYRDIDDTYAPFRYESLPPLPVKALGRGFQWLNKGKEKRQQGAWDRKWQKKLDQLGGQAAELGLTLPRVFHEFMGNEGLRRRVRSCTDCYFTWPRRIVESPAGEGGYLLRFYSDSQDCLHWYLYLSRPKYHCVVASEGLFGGDDWAEDDEDIDDESGEFWFCAPSFEAFVYRSWIENEIWYALSHDHDPLTAEEEAYLSHYRGK
jgi:uncharacterized protein (TIGR02996 family)